jgi:cold shock protein
MPRGKVKWFNELKGYGFIAPEEGGKDVFVHVTGLIGLKALQPDQAVSYELAKGERGSKAIDVQLLPEG